jgi:hypothetical protein
MLHRFASVGNPAWGQVTGCITRTAWLLLSYCFFLARDGALGPTTCSCIGAGALATHRQITAMAHAAIAADFDQPLDVHNESRIVTSKRFSSYGK